MLRANNLARVTQKRTIRPLYAWHSAVPWAAFLDTSAVGTSVVVYPGQVAVKTAGEQMGVADGPGTNTVGNLKDVPFGLFNNFIHGAMDEIGTGTEIGVWVGGRDAAFEILAGPAAAESPLANVAWTSLNATRGGVALFADVDGRLTNTGGSGLFQVARLAEAVSNTKIIIQLILSTIPNA